MRAALLAGSAALVLCLAATQIEGIALETVAHSAGQWAERARRVPAVVTGEVGHASLALGDGKIGRHAARARQLESIALDEGPVVAIAEREGELVLGTFDHGAWRVRGGARPEIERIEMDERINDLAFDAGGTLWAATAGGAWEIRPGEGAKRRAGGAFQAVAIWKGQAWFASPRGLSVADQDGFLTLGRDQGFPAESPTALASCGRLLCAGALDGLWLWDGEHALRAGSDTGSLPADFVTAVATGPAGLWAGTFDAGLGRLAPDARRFAPIDGLQDGRVQPHALVVGEDAAWAGTPAGLLEVRQDSAALVVDGLPTPEITALSPARAGGLWVGHQHGASRIVVEGMEEVQL